MKAKIKGLRLHDDLRVATSVEDLPRSNFAQLEISTLAREIARTLAKDPRVLECIEDCLRETLHIPKEPNENIEPYPQP